MKALFAGWRDGSEVRKTYFFIRGPELGFLCPYPVAHKFLELLIKGQDTAFWSLWVSPYTCMRSHSCAHVLNIICLGKFESGCVIVHYAPGRSITKWYVGSLCAQRLPVAALKAPALGVHDLPMLKIKAVVFPVGGRG